MMHIRYFITVLLISIVSACSSNVQISSPTEMPHSIIEPTSTEYVITPTLEVTSVPSNTPTSESTQDQDGFHTVLRFEFPFDPAPPGYLVNIKSNALTANLMCAVENGEILNLEESSNSSQSLGSCDMSSMTLDVLIPDEITVTVILGGFPVVNEVTKTPDTVTEQEIEYHFQSSLQ